VTTPPNVRRNADSELEKRCSRCRDWWPADREFYCNKARGTLGLSPYCHACEAERSNIRRRAAGVPPRRQEQPA